MTNSYGVPLIMPMGYLKWTTTGKYEINVEQANRGAERLCHLLGHIAITMRLYILRIIQ